MVRMERLERRERLRPRAVLAPAANDPDREECHYHDRGDSEVPVEVAEHRPEPPPLGPERATEEGEPAVPGAGGEGDRDERAPGAEIHEPSERRDHGAEGGEEAEEEHPHHTELEVLALDGGEGAGRDQPPAQRGPQEPPAEVPGAGVDGHRPEDAEPPGHEEDGEGIERAAIGQERREEDEDVRGGGREEVLDDDGARDHRVDEQRRPLRHAGEQLVDQRASTVATAKTATPSPRPTKPIPSLVFALMPTSSGAMPSSPAIACAIASLYTPRRGRSQTMVTSGGGGGKASRVMWSPARRSSPSESASFHLGSESGKSAPMSPAAEAPRMASVTAWATASASEWPRSPCSKAIRWPPRMNGRPRPKRWET